MFKDVGHKDFTKIDIISYSKISEYVEYYYITGKM